MLLLLKSQRLRLLFLVLAACSIWVLATSFGDDGAKEDVYNWRLHQLLITRQATSIENLTKRFLRDQEKCLRITPPHPDFTLVQPGETIVILDLEAFPASFIDSLSGEIGADGTVRFPVWIYEDAGSLGREIVIESLEQKVIVRIGRDHDYSPEWFVRTLYPSLDTYDAWHREWLTACYDPARVCLRYDLLVGENNLIDHVRARSIEAARLGRERADVARMLSCEERSISSLQFSAISLADNGTTELLLSWPDEGLSTNIVDIFACTDLRAGDWVVADTLMLDMQTNRVLWVDTESTNHAVRFYDVWTHHDSDGDGISDGREVRLYGTDQHQWDSDGDGLSDFEELFVHGTSALNADSDDDGLPDGWEVQHGLDPLDATGANGANGDPDGDGFTNIQEFQMGGDPTNPAVNANQLIHRLMHSRGDASLRVDIEDSANCGGINPNRQEVEDIFNIGPLMDCGYLLSLMVKGRVEDYNSGYDKVSVRTYTATELQSEVLFFSGHNNYNGCAMVNEQATINVWFWNNGSVRLRYDTVDGLYHTDAYAEITAAMFVDVLRVESINATSLMSGLSENPPPFPGHIPCLFDITRSPNPDKHLVVFYKDVVDSFFNVINFDVTLHVNILSTSITGNQLNEVWSKISGPASGSLIRTDTFEAKYKNPKLGGVYRFDYDLGVSDCPKSEANIVLPLAGAEVDSIISADIGRAKNFAAIVLTRYSWLQRQRPANGKRWFVNNGAGDYLGRPDNASTPTVWVYNQVNTSSLFGMGAVGTWKGKPVRIAKISNFMVGYAARKIGVNSMSAWISQVIGTWNDSAASKSWDAGWDIAGGLSYETIVTALVADIWDDADDKNQKLWPNIGVTDNYVTPNRFYDPDRQFTSPGFLYMTNP